MDLSHYANDEPLPSEPEDAEDLQEERDSSEESESDSEAERQVAQGFIVDDDEEDAEGEVDDATLPSFSEKPRKKEKKRKRKSEEGKKRRKERDDDGEEDLDEDDLDLLEENTGIKLSNRSGASNKLKRLRRRRSTSVEAGPRTLNDIFADDALPQDGEDYDEMAGFIEDDTASENEAPSGLPGNRRKDGQKKKRERRKIVVEGLDQESTMEVLEVFGDGGDYAWALEEEQTGGQKELRHIFEPSQIASRMLTPADELVRDLNIPERMQLESTDIPRREPLEDGSLAPFLTDLELEEAVLWMERKISRTITEKYLSSTNNPEKQNFRNSLKEVLRLMNVDFLEVPFIWTYRSAAYYYPGSLTERYLQENDLNTIAAQSVKYRAFLERRKKVQELFRVAKERALEDGVTIEDEWFEREADTVNKVESVDDLLDYLRLHYSKYLTDNSQSGFFSYRRASKDTTFSRITQSIIQQLYSQLDLRLKEVGRNLQTGVPNVRAYNGIYDLSPQAVAEDYVGGEFSNADIVLAALKLWISTDISHDLVIRSQIRNFYKKYAHMSVVPTDKGRTIIDDLHRFYPFKYLKSKPLVKMNPEDALYLQVMAAESEDLVTSSLNLEQESYEKFAELLFTAICPSTISTAEQGSIGHEWSTLIREAIHLALDESLLPLAKNWVKNSLVEEQEDAVVNLCVGSLAERVDTRPFCRYDNTMNPGDTPTVLAVSHGAGDLNRDSVVVVFLDSEGRVREWSRFADLQRQRLFHHQQQQEPDLPEDETPGGKDRKAFRELLKRRRPQAIVVGGFSPTTKKLMEDVTRLAEDVTNELMDDPAFLEDEQDPDEPPLTEDQKRERATFNLMYTFDEIARLYHSSKEAEQEFPDLSNVGRYALALARYVQNPLTEYCTLGSAITSLSFHPLQYLVRKDILLKRLELLLVELVNRVGLDVNRVGRDNYYGKMLKYVCGLGERKAAGFIKKLSDMGGTLTTRTQLFTMGLLPSNVLMNAAGFLRIPQDNLHADLKRDTDYTADVLDDTRVHPESYDIARKMAADALDYDEEDLADGKSPSKHVAEVFQHPSKLDDLQLDEFATELERMGRRNMRVTLYMIRDELKDPFKDLRKEFIRPTAKEVFQILTGETTETLAPRMIIPVRVVRSRADGGLIVKLDGGIDGIIPSEMRSETNTNPRIGQTLECLVIDINYETFEVRLSNLESNIVLGDSEARKRTPDQYFDHDLAATDGRTHTFSARKTRYNRNIDHPMWRNCSAGEAERILGENGVPRGECVIRPSSKEDHLAVTWKVYDGVYQHIAVFEMNKADPYSLGTQLKIGNKYTYNDLDELAFVHIKTMHKKVEELLAHEKCRGTKEEMTRWIQNFTMANPNTSTYAFGLDTSKPGEFVVGFRANHTQETQTWPIKVRPGAYGFMGDEVPDVQALCNAFKTAYQARQSATGGTTGAGGKTPYGRTPMVNAGGRTPMINAGGRTPGYIGGRTPGYQGGQTPGYSGQGGRTPNPGMVNNNDW